MTTPTGIAIRYDGADITGFVIWDGASFTQTIGGVAGTFEFRCRDMDRELSFVTGRLIELCLDGDELFTGVVQGVGRGYAFEADRITSDYANRIWTITGTDLNILFDRRILRHPADYRGFIPALAGSTTDLDVLSALLAHYIDADPIVGLRGAVGHTWGSGYTWKQQGTALRETVADLASYSGALYYIGADRYLNYRPLDTAVKRWGFSDTPNDLPLTSGAGFGGSTIGAREVEGTEDGTPIVNDALVWGGSEWNVRGSIAFARHQDAASIAAHGRWQLAESHLGEDNYKIDAEVDARARLIVDGPPGLTGDGVAQGLRYAQWQFRVAWFAHDVPLRSGARDWLVPGELSTFVFAAFGSGGTPLVKLLPLRELRITFPSTTPETSRDAPRTYIRFEGMFGLQPDDPFTLWAFLLKQQRLIAKGVGKTPIVTATSTSAPPGADATLVPTPAPDGATSVFTVPTAYVAGSAQLYINGLIQRWGTDYTESDRLAGQLTLTSTPVATDHLIVRYRVA